jgi:hypothetical protein
MALIIKDRVKETTTTTGTLPFVLGGAVNEYQTFSSTIGNANTTPYAVEDVGGINWEVGIGQYESSNNSLIRQTILASSNNNSIVNFSSGTKNIFVTVPAAYAALTARDLSQFAATTSANLLSIITDETGTGSLVFANNAVLSNTTISGGLVIDQTQETLTATSGVDGWSYVNSVSVVTQETAGHGISMSSDGTKMYIIGATNDNVYQYTLSSAFDVSTAVYSGLSFSVSATAGSPLSLYFKPDGTAFYIVNDSTSDTVQRYNLSTAWNISTASYLNSFTFTQETAPTGLEFSPDGTRLHIIGTATDTVYQFALSTPWDLTTTATTPTYTFSVATQETSPQGIEFNDTGTRMYIIGTTTDAILQYNLSTAWDLTTAVYDSRLLLMSGGYTINSPRDIYTDFSNNIALIIDDGADRIFQFATNTNALKITGNHFIVEPKTIFNNELGVYGLSRFFGAIEATGNIAVSGTLSGTITATGTLTAASTIALSGSTTSTTSLGTAASTGTTDIGGTGQTGAITVGRSTATQTLNLGTGATSSGSIKTINIGTAGVAGSNTNINIGSAASGGNVYFNQPVEIIDPLTIRRSPSQFLTIQNDDTTIVPFIRSFSANNNAKELYFDCSTIDLTPVTAGSLGYVFRINGNSVFNIDNSGTSIFTNTSTGPAVKINQRGAGPALLVEDETTPDSTPFVVDTNGNVGIGTASPASKLSVAGAAVGANVGDQTIYTIFSSLLGGNTDKFEISNLRLKAGSDWTGGGTRLQQKVDSSWMGYMQFNGNTNNGGISFGTGQSTTSANSIPEVFRINSSGAVGIGTTSPTAKLDVAGSVKISQDLSVSGNVYISGNTTTLSSNNLVLNDSIIYLANNNPANINDIGFVGNFTSGVYQHTGLVRDATDGVWKLFSNVVSEPTNTIDFTDAIYDSIRVGNVYGTVYGNANTATALATGRTIAISGAATGTATSFDGSQNITIPVTALNSANLTGTISNSLLNVGTTSSSGIVQLTDSISSTSTTTAATANSVKTAYDLASTKYSSSGGTINGNVNIAGTLAITSNTLVANLNSDMLDGKHVGTSGSAIAALDGINTWGGSQQFNNNVIITGSSGSSILRITQTGTGNALTVEDETNPDSTPFVVDANGSVGIGTSSPNFKLQVVGSFAATSKSFLIDHPTKTGMNLRYGSLESPYHGVRLTGEAVLTGKTVTVKLPDYIHALVKSDGCQIQLTNIKHDKVLWVDNIDIENDCFTVGMDRKFFDRKPYSFYWSFTAIRKDIEDMEVEF